MTRLQCEALLECERFPRGHYAWKPQAMQAMVERGFAEVAGTRKGRPVYVLTDAGMAMAAELRAKRVVERPSRKPRSATSARSANLPR
jgi:hypothetical protein